ncbi:SIMPL domain-containing protein [Halioglobus maricola]|nr:SIMPL domain-containing protein [Halioglobus maricola]
MNRSASLFTLLVFLSMALVAPVSASSPPGEIRTRGEAEAKMAPDMATVQLTVTREAATAREALDANSAAMAEVIAAMKAAGVEEPDLQTSNFGIQPRYVYPKPRNEKPPVIAGYRVRNTLSVIVRELDNLGVLLDQSVSLGVNEGGSVSFGNSDPSSAIDAARADAVRDAMSRAKTLAGAAGVKLGDIISITEQTGDSHPRPVMMSRAVAAEADSVPIAAGVNSYRVTVQLSITIEQ